MQKTIIWDYQDTLSTLIFSGKDVDTSLKKIEDKVGTQLQFGVLTDASIATVITLYMHRLEKITKMGFVFALDQAAPSRESLKYHFFPLPNATPNYALRLDQLNQIFSGQFVILDDMPDVGRNKLARLFGALDIPTPPNLSEKVIPFYSQKPGEISDKIIEAIVQKLS